MAHPVRWTARLGAVLLMLCSLLPARAQTSADAAALFQAQDWPAAEAAYAGVVAQDASNGQAWYRLGYTRHLQEKYADAAEAWMQADQLGFAPPRTRYNLAAAYARLGRTDEAFAWLEKATQAGFNGPQLLDSDADLATLRDDDRFAAARLAADRNARPCHYDERRRQFDFWVGSWDVFTPQGQQAGTNTIELILNECTLKENWQGASGGGGGKSFNYYDPEEQHWKQLWIDAGGNHADFTGTFTDGAMRFEGVWTTPSGTTSLMTMTFTPRDDGSVRQHIEQSLDDGATWNVWFDGTYVRQQTDAGGSE